MKKTIPTVLTAAALLVAVTGCGSGSDDAEAGDAGTGDTLKVGNMGLTSDAALQIGIDKGFFKDEGVTIDRTTISNPPAGIAAAQSGQIDLTYTPTIPMLNAMSQGVPLKAVSAADGAPAVEDQPKDPSKIDDTGLYVAPKSGITRPKQLTGKSVAVPARKAQLEVTVANAVAEDGGDPTKIKWMVLDFSSALQSLNQGRVDAASLVSPFTSEAAKKGDPLIASPGIKFFEEGAVGVYVAGESTVSKKPKQLESFRAGINKANAYCNDHLAECQEVGSKITKVSLPTIKEGAITYWPTTVDPKDLERVNKKLVDLGYLESEVDLDGVQFEPAG